MQELVRPDRPAPASERPQPADAEIERRAHHEAGHAVVCARLGLEFDRVVQWRLVPAAGVRTSEWPTFDIMVAAAAGPISEMLCCDSTVSPVTGRDLYWLQADAEPDDALIHANAFALVDRLYDGPEGETARDAEVHCCIAEALVLVRADWAAIALVAEALQWSGDVSYAKIRRILK